MEALSRREENEIHEAAKKEALRDCDDYVKDFADCATGRTFSLPFACKTRLNAMQGCMRDYMTQERMDAMKLDFIAHRSEKGREAVEALRKSREEKLRKMAGIKDEPARI
ncbi:hypothetical protein J008_01617 [Cryptococcus neoformans]|nr:hypothetical protein C362_01148 [Cryptococcus neoformans var. grubii Bt1]OWZ69307.1 hypothetical protein AYX15_00157 [Cryptococcus neoformans var. grubii]OWZ79556.1 hypothetical protein C365_01818 [Cryptococcus neoformans var. grubii Bt85]OXG21061.1 hypothetical protein C366_01614 [Cryptococcus neoformans var. grubii Tu401-1]OXG30917.1 hypothetical protein C367_01638 [Cryptococcus neoformans var. grubii Ze90-1]